MVITIATKKNWSNPEILFVLANALHQNFLIIAPDSEAVESGCLYVPCREPLSEEKPIYVIAWNSIGEHFDAYLFLTLHFSIFSLMIIS